MSVDVKNVAEHIFDKKFLESPKQYLIQSLLAVVALAIILYFVEVLTHAAIVAALGASVFIVFAMPNTIAADKRRIIGGHVTGVVCGLICYYAFFTGPLAELCKNIEFIRWVAVALSVGLSILLMVALNFEHPPAAGTALGIATHEWSWQTVVFIVVFAVCLAVIKWLLRRYLKDLYT